MRRLVLCACASAVIMMIGGCGDDTANPADERPVTTSTTASPPTSPPPTDAPIPADYEFAVTAAVEQLGPSGDRQANAVYPGQSLRLDFTNTTGPENPCPSEADIEVVDIDGAVAASARGFAVEIPVDGLTGPLTITARCERGTQTGVGVWESIELLELLEVTLGAGHAEAGDPVDVMVSGRCADGSGAGVDLVFAEGAALGMTVELGTDGRGTFAVPEQLPPQTLYVRAECTGDVGAIAFAALDIGSALTGARSDPIEYQPDVVLSLVEPGACGETWRPAMVTTNPGHAQEFAQRGYVGVVVEARNPGNTGALDTSMLQSIATATNDLAIAVQWLRANADTYCIEPDAIAAMGNSFWGISALSLAYSEGELAEGDVVTIDEFGGSATVGSPPPAPPPELAGYSDDIAAAVSFAGFALPGTIDFGEPPSILFHGRDDPTVPFALAEQTCAAASAVGVTCELIAHDAGHSMADDVDAAWDIVAEFLEREMLIPAGITARTSGPA